MRATRRTTLLRAAAVSGAAAVALALPTGAAFADDAPPTAPPARPEQQAGPEQPAEPTTPSAGPKEQRRFVTTVRLADGSVAKVHRVGPGHFEADVYAGSTKLDTLVSKNGRAAHGRHNGLHVVLQPNGTVTSWVEGTKPAPKPEPKPAPERKGKPVAESSVRVNLPGGRIGKLVDGPQGKRVEIATYKGERVATVDLKNPSVFDDGWTYKLVQDGKRVKFVVIDGRGGGDSWGYDFGGRLIEQYTAERT
ncbi:hypothetical protein [Streptomyces sp. WAC06614]|uniref:hypothetical protein n=1 Tax=Streptomyces sp. WAC06614 TaxID=2487416 RepID=UPI000F767836|nr:hypothetical protein [Streptomyces sp. WAC06614]RSS83801.1 hypothetical protein EF918_02385 [Streptomyces sp. WAC06614]